MNNETVFYKTTLYALKIFTNNKSRIEDAWNSSIKKHTKSENTQKKGCPRNTFFSLCTCGYVKGIPKVCCKKAENSKEKEYALKAIELLKEKPELRKNKSDLWSKISGTSHQSQLDVVFALLDSDNINLNLIK